MTRKRLLGSMALAMGVLGSGLLWGAPTAAAQSRQVSCDDYTTPSVSISPTAVRSGGTLRVQATGLPPSTAVEIVADRRTPSVAVAIWSATTTDSLGRLDTSVVVPTNAVVGGYVLRISVAACPTRSPSTNFAVIPNGGGNAPANGNPGGNRGNGNSAVLSATTIAPRVLGVSQDRSNLAFTGTATRVVAGAGTLLLVLGALLIGARRRRRAEGI